MNSLKEFIFDIFFTGGRLRNKLFFMIVAIALTPLVSVSFLSLYTSTLSHKNDVAIIEDNILFQKSVEIQNFIDEILSTFKIHFNLPLEQLIVKEDEEITYAVAKKDLNNILQSIMEENSFIEETSFIDASILRDKNEPTNVYGLEVAKVSKNGENSEAFSSLKNLSYFQSAARGKDYVSEVFFTAKGPMVIIASPVRNDMNRIIGVLTGQVNLLGIQKIVSRTQFGNSGYLYVVDREGRIVASSRERGSIKPTNLSGLALISDVLLGKDRLGIEGQGRFTSFWNEQVIGAGKKLRSLDLSLIAEWPVSDVDSFINTIRNYMILFSVITLLLILVSSIFISHRIVHPIEILEKGAERIAKGNFEEPVTIITRDEIERLGTAFNSMMMGLKEFRALKDEFVFIAAHELRTPVTAIRGYLSMIEDGDAGPVPPKIKEYLDPVMQSNMRLVTLVNDLLEVARQEAGRITIQTAKIDNLGMSISAVIKDLKPLADKKQITVLYDDRAVKPVMTDESRLKEVMVNLLSNAVKYTLGSGKVSIWHDVRENMLVTHVRDSGIGIPKEAQAKLFEKFYRVQDERLRNVTGTGLGLFIIKQLIERMGGKIWFVSEPGQGTTFSFSLPLAF